MQLNIKLQENSELHWKIMIFQVCCQILKQSSRKKPISEAIYM